MDCEINIKDISITQLLEWNINKNINPITKRKIKTNGKTYDHLKNKYNKVFPCGYDFFDCDFRDPVSLAEIWTERDAKKEFVYPNYQNLILYEDKNGIINCFEKETLEYFNHHKNNIHPVTYTKIPSDILKLAINTEIDYSKSTPELALEVFQNFNNISVFLDHNEFLKLEEDSINKLYYETFEFFHENLPDTIVKNIKDKGNDNQIKIYNLLTDEFRKLEFKEKQKKILNTFNFLLNFKDDNIKLMIYYIILGGLGLLIPKIKEDYPDFCFNF